MQGSQTSRGFLQRCCKNKKLLYFELCAHHAQVNDRRIDITGTALLRNDENADSMFLETNIDGNKDRQISIEIKNDSTIIRDLEIGGSSWLQLISEKPFAITIGDVNLITEEIMINRSRRFTDDKTPSCTETFVGLGRYDLIGNNPLYMFMK